LDRIENDNKSVSTRYEQYVFSKEKIFKNAKSITIGYGLGSFSNEYEKEDKRLYPHNIVLEISNCVAYFSIVKFSSIFAFRQTLYRSNFLSLRNFERFKNNLSWQLITKIYIQRPIDLYNNRYEILILRTNGIYGRTIYANRSKEITSLNNFSLLTLIFIEFRDFLTSRLDEAIYFVSKSVRFTLTSGLGQLIGLVWRGIIEGLKK